MIIKKIIDVMDFNNVAQKKDFLANSSIFFQKNHMTINSINIAAQTTYAKFWKSQSSININNGINFLSSIMNV